MDSKQQKRKMRVLRYLDLFEDAKLESLYRYRLKYWLAAIGLHVRFMNRDFTDAVLIANILSVFHPKLVRLDKYPRFSNTLLKLSNWMILNWLVLRHLDMKLPDKILHQLAKGNVVVTELLLFDVMQHVFVMQKNYRALDDTSGREEMWRAKKDMVDIDVSVSESESDPAIAAKETMKLHSTYGREFRKKSQIEAQCALMEKKLLQYQWQLKRTAERIKAIKSDLYKLKLQSKLCRN